MVHLTSYLVRSSFLLILNSFHQDSEYDLIPSHMTLFPIVSPKCMWYHCNLVGCKRETPLKGVQQYFFIEINITRVKTVTSCIALGMYMFRQVADLHKL
jgi:hypothetical protein